MENENRKRVVRKRRVTKNRDVKVHRSKGSENPYDNPVCSACQASGKMIATLSSELCPGVTVVLDRRAFVGKPISARIQNIDWNRIDFIPTLMQLIVVNQKQFEKWQEDHADVE